MTAAQKAAKEKFSKAIAYRSKTGVSLKEAFAHVYGKKVSAVKKKAAPKKKAAVKKGAPKKKAAPKKAAIKKVIAKKVAPKKKAATKKVTGSHKDTKSHNVNIRVVSGVDQDRIDLLQEIIDVKNAILEQIEDLKKLENSYKETKDPQKKLYIKYDIGVLKYNFIPHNKRYLRSLKASLKKSI